jgi:predicted O-methyltransferase YrrM
VAPAHRSPRRELATSREEITKPLFNPIPPGTPVKSYDPATQTAVETVGTVSPRASVWPTWGLFLMRLVRELRPRSCLEVGTGYGLSGCYQAAALALNGEGRIVTLEGASARARIADQGFAALGLGRVEAIVGPLHDTLPGAARRAAPVDYAFVDAGHGEAETLEHFRTLAPHLEGRAVVVFDDIRWSDGMRRAWAQISRHPAVTAAIDVHRMGVCVVAGDQAREAGSAWSAGSKLSRPVRRASPSSTAARSASRKRPGPQ